MKILTPGVLPKPTPKIFRGTCSNCRAKVEATEGCSRTIVVAEVVFRG